MNYIVDFKDTATEEAINHFLLVNNATIIKTYSLFDKTFLVSAENQPTDQAGQCESITQDVDNLVIPLRMINVDKSYGLPDANAPEINIDQNATKDWWKVSVVNDFDFDVPLYTLHRSGSNTTVYVLDSGIQTSHMEFAGSSVTNLWSFTGDFTDKSGHGTAIASIINGQTCGVSNAIVKSVKIFDPDQLTKQSDMLNALDVIYADVVSNPNRSAVINCSWAITKNELIESKLRVLIMNGVMVIAAAGNSGMPIANVTPAGMPDAFTIGSYNSDLVPSNFSDYTNPNSIQFTPNQVNDGALDGWAPGEEIWAANLNGQYSMMGGTSMAAAVHTAVLAYNLGLSKDAPVVIVDQDRLRFIWAWSLRREGLIDLSDPKYAGSVNKITTLLPNIWSPSGLSENLVIGKGVRAYSGKTWVGKICEPYLVKQIEIIGDLPPNVEIYPSMIVYGTAPIIANEPNLQTVNIKITDNNDQLHEVTFDFVTWPDDWTSSSTTGDVELDLRLLACGVCGSFGCEQAPDFCCINSGCSAGWCSPYFNKSYCPPTYTTCLCGEYWSDENLKENITTITDPLDKLSKLKGVEFDWKDQYINQLGPLVKAKHDVGVIAQDVERIFPGLVNEKSNGFKMVQYEKLIALLIEAVKEQQIQIDDLKRRS